MFCRIQPVKLETTEVWRPKTPDILRRTKRGVAPFGGVAVFCFSYRRSIWWHVRSICRFTHWKSSNHVHPTITFVAFLCQALPDRRNPVNVFLPQARPRVVLRYANANELLVSVVLDNDGDFAQHAAVIDAPFGEGHVVMFSNNPFWRAETKGSYFLVFDAIMIFDSPRAGRKLADR